ncbi:MAG: hypothetical protein LUI87_17015 [Lachnospiraceae bacterium]|nr:hypothetical protein [Lachnospiraceae bacterium]
MTGYRKSELSFEDAKTRLTGYPCALVYQMSEVSFGKTEDITINWDELLEARFFSESGELHLFRCEKEWKAVEIEDAELADTADTGDIIGAGDIAGEIIGDTPKRTPGETMNESGGSDDKAEENYEKVTAVLLKNYQLAPKYRACGGELVVKEYLSEDEDGQVFVQLTRLCGIA